MRLSIPTNKEHSWLPECSETWLSSRHCLLSWPLRNNTTAEDAYCCERLSFPINFYLMGQEKNNNSQIVLHSHPCQRNASSISHHLVKSAVRSNLAAYEVFEPSWDALKMRYAAMHIVMLPTTVRAPWRATRTCGSSKKTNHEGKQYEQKICFKCWVVLLSIFMKTPKG